LVKNDKNLTLCAMLMSGVKKKISGLFLPASWHFGSDE
jgi:hypothetical protein